MPSPSSRVRAGAPLGPTRRHPLDGEGRGEGSADYWTERGRERVNGLPLGAQVALLPSPRAADASGGRIDLRVGRPNGRSLPTAVSLLPTPRATVRSIGGPGQRGSSGDLAMPSAVQPQNFGRYAWAVERWGRVHGPAPQPTEPGPRGGVRMAAAFPEWMMGLAPGFVTDVLSRRAALHAIGNGVFPLQAYTAFGHLAPLLP
jgi:DNA (cytosine-5)-methyltransferase 1